LIQPLVSMVGADGECDGVIGQATIA